MPPVIASHHRTSEWQPRLEWSSDVTVQWGGRGLVLGREQSYTTAFFEVFPNDGSAGFIRGEGKTLEDAEASAHSEWNRNKDCLRQSGHRWTRARRLTSKDGKPRVSTYINGGCFCLRCGAFESAMSPIVTLGDWKRPLSSTELDSIAFGSCRDDREVYEGSRQYRRRLQLRAKVAGIALPDPAIYDPTRIMRDDEPYALACRRAVGKYCLESSRKTESKDDCLDSMEGFFRSFSERHLDEMKEEAAALEGTSS